MIICFNNVDQRIDRVINQTSKFKSKCLFEQTADIHISKFLNQRKVLNQSSVKNDCSSFR